MLRVCCASSELESQPMRRPGGRNRPGYRSACDGWVAARCGVRCGVASTPNTKRNLFSHLFISVGSVALLVDCPYVAWPSRHFGWVTCLLLPSEVPVMRIRTATRGLEQPQDAGNHRGRDRLVMTDGAQLASSTRQEPGSRRTSSPPEVPRGPRAGGRPREPASSRATPTGRPLQRPTLTARAAGASPVTLPHSAAWPRPSCTRLPWRRGHSRGRGGTRHKRPLPR